MHLFQQWIKDRNQDKSVSRKCPPDLLDKLYPPPILDKWLAAFIMEVRRTDGGPYTPVSMNCIISGIQRHLRFKFGVNAPNICEKKSTVFPLKCNALEARFRQLRADGVGVVRKRAPVVTEDDENTLWERGVMSFETPQSLLNAVFYYNGRNFCLRGIREHHNLHFSQIVRLTNPDRYQYIEHGSKNNAGGVDEFKLDVKTVTVTAVKSSAHCHVRILDHYLYHLPKDVSLDGQFYLRPLDCVSKEVWYSRCPLGFNKIQGMVKSMFQEAQIATKYTNHSLRATGAARMFAAGVPEAVIQQRTGHRSVKNLRVYETRGSEEVHAVAVSNVLAGKNKSFRSEYRKVKSGKSDVRVTSCETDNSFDHIDDSFFDEVAGKIPL